ncbi:hypothetical protein [Cellulophaga omnivescoria]|uniref:hypothetical protein n=1 Tax=Cellulophaga omnivescoria TaxID=1888890 RepID=UPI000984E12A|nr:hypothetical protein [Cellulophaga omnivescoria]WBU88289.1 hypothetical protein PBN93_10455 [Cellulophaga omnivescoria]
MKSKLLLLLLFLLVHLQNSAQNKKVLLEETITNVIIAFREKNTKAINNYVSKENGITILVKYGVLNNYKIIDSLNFKNPTPNYLPYAEPVSNAKITYNTSPTFDCNTYTWSTKGLFCDTLKTNALLSNTIKNLKYELSSTTYSNELKRALDLEKISYRIILVDKNDEDLIFYLSYINKKWMLTLIDRVTTDCSA